METVKALIRKKPLFFVILTGIYVILTVFLRWHIHLSWDTLWFVIGAAVGIYFLDGAELFFRLEPSPFRSVVFGALFIVVSFFIVTSSASTLAAGLVLSLYLQMMLWQTGEWRLSGNLDSWYRQLAQPLPHKIQLWILWGSIGFFVLETAIFVR